MENADGETQRDAGQPCPASRKLQGNQNQITLSGESFRVYSDVPPAMVAVVEQDLDGVPAMTVNPSPPPGAKQHWLKAGAKCFALVVVSMAGAGMSCGSGLGSHDLRTGDHLSPQVHATTKREDAPSAKGKAKGAKGDFRGRKAEDDGQKPDDGGQRAEDGQQTTDCQGGGRPGEVTGILHGPRKAWSMEHGAGSQGAEDGQCVPVLADVHRAEILQELRLHRGLLQQMELKLEKVANNDSFLRRENEELRQLNAEGYFNFAVRVKGDDFLAFAVIMALGNRKAAAEHLNIPARTLYHRVNQWAGRGKDYQIMIRYMEWRKRSSRHLKVDLNPSLQTGESDGQPENPDTMGDVLTEIHAA